MPAPTPIEDSQGATVYWNGGSIGTYVSLSGGMAVAQAYETTSVDNAVIGTLGNSRVVKTYDATSVEPGAMTVRYLGTPGGPGGSISRADIGKNGTLFIQWASWSIEAQAFISDWQFELARGELVQCALSFQLTGN